MARDETRSHPSWRRPSRHQLSRPRRSLAGTRHGGDSWNLTGWRLAVYRPVSRQERDTRGGRLYRSHLWAVDLGCFEAVLTGSEVVKKEQQPAYNRISKAAAT